MSVLLREAHGFEGFLRFLIKANASDPASTNLEDESTPRRSFDAISPSGLRAVRNDDRITGLDEAIRLDLDLLERFEECSIEPRDVFPSPVDARFETPGRRPIHLNIGMVQCLQGL